MILRPTDGRAVTKHTFVRIHPILIHDVFSAGMARRIRKKDYKASRGLFAYEIFGGSRPDGHGPYTEAAIVLHALGFAGGEYGSSGNMLMICWNESVVPRCETMKRLIKIHTAAKKAAGPFAGQKLYRTEKS